MSAVILDLNSVIKFSDEDFFKLAAANRNLRMERAATGEVIIMPPVGGERSKRNADLITELNLWNRQAKLGIVFDSSGGFHLPMGGDRSPDASWIKLDRWQALTYEQRRKFLPLCPDFVIELRSESDSIKTLQDKMQEYLENGLRLGWLIDPKNRRVEVYRQNREVEVLEFPTTLLGENVLPGFVLELQLIWE